MRNLILGFFVNFVLSYAQGWAIPQRGYMLRFGILGFLFLVLVFLLFSIIFWAVYLFLVKGRTQETKKIDNNATSAKSIDQSP
ncbi:MAG: hypothetical protein ABIK93_03280 [candidate division WOR-3 bacterium]